MVTSTEKICEQYGPNYNHMGNKAKASRNRHGRLKAKRLKQISWIYYNQDSKASPVVNMTTF